MQSISTVEADSKVILLLVNFACTAITRLSVSSLANVSRKINVGKGFFWGMSQWLVVSVGLTLTSRMSERLKSQVRGLSSAANKAGIRKLSGLAPWGRFVVGESSCARNLLSG